MNINVWFNHNKNDIFFGTFQYVEPNLYLQLDKQLYEKWWLYKDYECGKIFLQPFSEHSRNTYLDYGINGLNGFWEEAGDIIFDFDGELIFTLLLE